MTLKNDTKFGEESTCRFKIDMRNLTNFDLSTRKSQKIFTLMGSFWAKYILFELKKYRGVIFHDTEEWCKIWRKTDLRFGKWLGEFGNFSPDHLKVSKLGFWRDPLTQSRKCLSLKLTEELCVMTMKNDAKFEQEWTCCFKIYRNLTNSDLFVNLKDMLFYWVIWPQYIMFELKKVMFDGTEDWCKIWRKTDLCFQKWHKEFLNLHRLK